MADFLEIKSIKKEDQDRIMEEIKELIANKKKEGIFTEKEIQEIEEMKLHHLPDIQDVQSVYEDFLFKKEE